MTLVKNNICNESCLDTMSRWNDSCIDLVITSPPYDSQRDYKGYTFPFADIAKELTRVLKPGGVIVWIVNDQTKGGSETLSSFKQAIYFKEECGLFVHDTMIWAKKSATMPSSNRYDQVTEYMFVLSKGKPKTINLIKDKPNKWAGKSTFAKNNSIRQTDGSLKDKGIHGKYAEFGNRYNVWNHNTSAQENPCKKQWHPATFPLQLVKDHVISWSNEGDIVYDPFMGSGTTAKACVELNRFYVGSEISKEYYDSCLRELSEMTSPLF